MKEFFGIDKTADRSNDRIDAQGHETLTLTGEDKARYDRYNDSVGAVNKGVALPTWLKIVKYFTGAIALASVIGILKGVISAGFDKAMSNFAKQWWIFAVLGGFAAVFIGVCIYGAVKKRGMLDSPEVAEVESSEEEIESLLKRRFYIPENCAAVDVFTYSYKEHEPENRIPEEFGGHFVTDRCGLFKRNGALCIWNADKLWEIPLKDIDRIELENKRYCTANWIKEQELDKEPFSSYKLFTDNLGRIWMRQVGRLYFMLDNESFLLRFPVWELEVFEHMTEKRAIR